MHEEQRVVQTGAECELVRLEEECRRPAHERRQDRRACIVDLDLFDARIVELALPAIELGQRDRCADMELATGDERLHEVREEVFDVKLRHATLLPGPGRK
jgi:hypothetical protein